MKPSPRSLTSCCNACGASLADPFLCSACKAVVYCSLAHQKEDWKAHKPLCKQKQAEAAEAAERAKTTSPLELRLRKLSPKDLLKECKSLGLPTEGLLEKGDIIAALCAADSEPVPVQLARLAKLVDPSRMPSSNASQQDQYRVGSPGIPPHIILLQVHSARLTMRPVSEVVALAENGCMHAQFVVATARVGGDRLALFKQAAEGGHADAAAALGAHYVNNSNPALGIKYWEMAADLGSPFAMWTRGLPPFLGLGGVKKDRKEAEKWFRKAAAFGHIKAIENLLEMGIRV